MLKLNAIINAGGQSLRFGADKAEMVINGKRIMDLLIENLSGICQQIIIVSNARDAASQLYRHPDRRGRVPLPETAPLTVVTDVICGIGPLGGIHAGLLASNTDYNLVLACDMPFINKGFIEYMVSQIKPGDEAIIPVVDNRPEPLCGIYARGCIKVIEELAASRKVVAMTGKKAREFCILHLLDNVRTRYVEEEVIRQFDPQLRMFFNINTLQDMEEAEKMWEDYNPEIFLLT